MWTAEQLEIQALAHEFAAGEIRPHTSRWDQEKDLDDEIFGKLGEMGFLGMRVPERYGGLELEFSTYVLALEQLAWGDASVALSVAIHNGPVTTLLLEHGSDEQKEALLPALASGSTLGALALSEPGSEGHAHRLTTTASRSGDTWRLDGTERWVTNGDRAGLVVVLAATENSSESPAGAFLVPRESLGYSVVGREATMGLRGSQIVSVEFDGVEIERDQVLGDPTKGFEYALGALRVAWVGIAAQAVGIAQSAFEHAVSYALERHQFGQAIADFGAIQDKLAGMASRIAGARVLTHAAAARLEGPSPSTGVMSTLAMTAIAKLTAADCATWVTDEAVQVFGGYGYMRDYPVEQLMRDAKGMEIYEGTSEVLRSIIAGEVLKEARDRQ